MPMHKLAMTALVALTVQEASSLPVSSFASPNLMDCLDKCPAPGGQCTFGAHGTCDKIKKACGDNMSCKNPTSGVDAHCTSDNHWPSDVCTITSSAPPAPPSPPPASSPPPSPPAPPTSPPAKYTNSIFCNPVNDPSLSCRNIIDAVGQDMTGYIVDFTRKGDCNDKGNCFYGIGSGTDPITPEKLTEAITGAREYAGIMVDFEVARGFAGDADVVDKVKDFLQSAKHANLKVGVTTGGSGFTSALCDSLGHPTASGDYDPCLKALHAIFQLEWDIWMPQMYSKYMANNASFDRAQDIWKDFKGEIIPVVGVKGIDVSKDTLMNKYSGGCDKILQCDDSTCYDHSPGYDYLHDNINGLASFPYIGLQCQK